MRRKSLANSPLDRLDNRHEGDPVHPRYRTRSWLAYHPAQPAAHAQCPFGRDARRNACRPRTHAERGYPRHCATHEKVDWPAFTVWLSALLYAHGDRILRIKGLLETSSADTRLAIHGVQHVMHPPTHLAKDEDDTGSFLVFITRGMEQQQIRDSLRRLQTL